uniref:Small ribosomal subunit protein mS35 mitochondrial conserved domain-containing protein n=1 Tax=Gadus morhua TaxID=8049 RepID=A0A8C5C2E1_GADMO
MAAHTTKICLSLGRINGPGFGQYASLNRATYATALSTSNFTGNKGGPDRGGRGAFVRRPRREPGEPRTEKMDSQQDWSAVYPSAASFRPGSVPLPVRMGYPVKGGVPSEKRGNLELIKIPNFLHLTPAAIKKHCEALKRKPPCKACFSLYKCFPVYLLDQMGTAFIPRGNRLTFSFLPSAFCTEWPAGLDSDGDLDKHLPIQIETTDYVSAGPSVRNPAARVVTLRVRLSSLNLDEHAREKMLKLLGDRYCKDTDILTITTDSCPLKQQNTDYAMYLLTVLYHEAWKTEAWESEMTRADRREYIWEDSASQQNVLDTLARMATPVPGEGVGEGVGEGEAPPREVLLARPEVQQYRDSVTRLKNEGESEGATLRYREAVKKLLSL